MSALFLISMLFGLAFGQATSFCIPTEYIMHFVLFFIWASRIGHFEKMGLLVDVP